jgi:hypothetical protein
MIMETDCGTGYVNRNNVDALFWLQGRPLCETGSLHRELAGMAFLTSFAREVGASLDSREVALAAAKLLYNYFHYDLAVFSLHTHYGGMTAFSPLDETGCMRVFLIARESFHELKPLDINGYCHLGLAAPVQARISGYPNIVEIVGNGIKIALYCGEDSEGKATHDLLTGIAESLTTALRNAREHDRVKELSVRDRLTGLYNRRVLQEILVKEESKRTPTPLAILISGKSMAPKNILARADQALYQAKRSGKNRVCLHEAKHDERKPEIRRRAVKLPAALQFGGTIA